MGIRRELIKRAAVHVGRMAVLREVDEMFTGGRGLDVHCYVKSELKKGPTYKREIEDQVFAYVQQKDGE